MAWCAAVYCNNTSRKNKEKSFFLMPKDVNLSKIWKKAINRTELPNKAYLCSDHFDEKYFDKSWELQNKLYYKDRPIKRKLVPGAIPSIFPHKPKPVERVILQNRENKQSRKKVCFGIYGHSRWAHMT